MAQLDTILTNFKLASADQQFSSPAQFGSQVGGAIQGAGEALGSVGGVVAKLEQVKKQQSDTQWVGDSMAQEQNYVNKWMADPQNNSKTTFSDDLSDLLKERQQEYEKNAPNPDAKLAFRQQFQDFSVSRLHSAFTTSAANQIQRLQESTLGQIDQAISGYSISRTVPNLDANGDLINNIKSIGDNIDKTYGSIAPEMARTLKGKLVTDSIYASMNYSPELARKILAMSDVSTIEGRQRHSIEDEINQAERTQNSGQVAAFDQYRQNWIAQVEAGKQRDKIDHSLYYSHYSRDQANEHILRDETLIDVYNNTNDFVNRVSPYNAEAQISELKKLQDKVGTNPDTAFVDSKSYELAEQKIQKNLELIKSDPVGYIISHNPVMKGISAKYQSAPDDAKPGILADMSRKLVQYQGAPTGNHILSLDEISAHLANRDYSFNPADSKTDNNLYFNIPRNSVSVMTKEQASDYAAEVNHGSPKDALKTINQVLQQYPEDLRANAFNDMVKLPDDKRIRGEFWAAVINNKAPWIDDYLGAVQNAEAIKKASADKQTDFDKAINSNTTWLHFSNPLSSDNFQRQAVTEDFRSGIMLYAMGLAQKTGMTPDAAVKKSVENLLNSNMGMTAVNGNGVIVPRDNEDGTMKSDADVNDIGRRLSLALKFIDPAQIKTTDEFGRNIFSTLRFAGTDQVKQDSLRDAVLKNGAFQTTPDGKAVTLYYKDGANTFEMRDSNNKAFVINLKDLPKFENRFIPGGSLGTGATHAGQMGIPIGGDPLTPQVTEKHIPIDVSRVKDFDKLNATQKMIVSGDYSTIYQTNYPGMPNWIYRK